MNIRVNALILALALGLSAPAAAAPPPGPELIKALQGGGYVIVMRHASSPRTPPAPAEVDPGNTGAERQLDKAGKTAAAEMGAAIKALRIPIGEVWSSPTFRAVQTVRLAGLPPARTAPELGDGGGPGMQAAAAGQAAWLKALAARPPKAGADVLVVTHFPNITAAFGQDAAGIADGEALVFHPVANGAPELAGRIRIEEWPALAKGGG